MTRFAWFLGSSWALGLGVLSACANSPPSATTCDGTDPGAADAGSRADVATGDGGSTPIDAGRCGEIAPGDYATHWTSLDHLPNCGLPSDATVHLTGPIPHSGSCTFDQDLDACTLTYTCKDINGRYETTDTDVWKIPGHGPLTTFVEDSTSSTVDDLTGTVTTCRWEVTYTKT